MNDDGSRDDYSTFIESLFDPFFTRGASFVARDGYDMEPWPPLYFDRATLLRNGYIPEPPYARILRKLGLFDPIELPKNNRRQSQSTFPIVVHSANAPQRRARSDEENMSISLGRVSDELSRVSDELKHDGGRIIGSIGEVFGETSRWAMGSLLGHLRDAADHIETRIQRDGSEDEKSRDDMSKSFYKA
ncbi:hypothetical protein GGF43_007018, partial [Coemansia sp. RSA 2618]